VETVNAKFVGVGGQGVLLASELFARILISRGFDVKKSEIHGMAQRGGAVASQVRFGRKVYSPVIADGEVDYLISFDRNEGRRNEVQLRQPDHLFWLRDDERSRLTSAKTVNVALLAKFLRCFERPGALADYPDFAVTRAQYTQLIRETTPPGFFGDNLRAVDVGYGVAL